MAKYLNKKSGEFDSKKEERRWTELELLQRCGEIEDLVYHPTYPLIPKQDGERGVNYEADFQYFDKQAQKVVVEDVKSPYTRKLPAYIIKRKLMLFIHGIKVVEV